MKTEVFTDSVRGLIGIEEDMLKAIYIESDKQIRKWDEQTHSLFEWLTYTTEELGELAKEISEYTYRDGSLEEIEKEAIQVAVLSLKIWNMSKRRRLSSSIQIRES